MAPVIHNISTILMSVIRPSTYFIVKESGDVEVRHWTSHPGGSEFDPYLHFCKNFSSHRLTC